MLPNLRYRKPCLVNEYAYRQKPSRDGTLPEDPYQTKANLSSDSCSGNDEEEQQEQVLETDDSEILEKLKENPLPQLFDKTRLDKIFILPLFCKPGTHQYMIKYKDSNEPTQKRLLKQIRR